MRVSAIAAMAKNRVIGVDNDLPWHLPEDLKFFRDKTKGALMIMGRKTYESLGKPLPGRFHLVVTRNPEYKVAHERVRVVQSIDEALEMARSMSPPWPDEVFVVGGGEIYAQSLARVDVIYLTRIERDYAGSARFPEFESGGQFRLSESRDGQPEATDEPHYRFETWSRIQN